MSVICEVKGGASTNPLSLALTIKWIFWGSERKFLITLPKEWTWSTAFLYLSLSLKCWCFSFSSIISNHRIQNDERKTMTRNAHRKIGRNSKIKWHLKITFQHAHQQSTGWAWNIILCYTNYCREREKKHRNSISTCNKTIKTNLKTVTIQSVQTLNKWALAQYEWDDQLHHSSPIECWDGDNFQSFKMGNIMRKAFFIRHSYTFWARPITRQFENSK